MRYVKHNGLLGSGMAAQKARPADIPSSPFRPILQHLTQ
jgi:hypothetical protein